MQFRDADFQPHKKKKKKTLSQPKKKKQNKMIITLSLFLVVLCATAVRSESLTCLGCDAVFTAVVDTLGSNTTGALPRSPRRALTRIRIHSLRVESLLHARSITIF